MKIESTKHSKIILTAGAILLSGCQTIESQRALEMKNVIAKQEALIDAVLAERESANVKMEVAKSATLKHAEAHLKAALEELKDSDKTMKGAMSNARHQ